MFVNRVRELAFLEKHYASGKAEMLVLYGRRRVGKTELLRRFCEDKPLASLARIIPQRLLHPTIRPVTTTCRLTASQQPDESLLISSTALIHCIL